ncbi:MAG: hypothetical protein V1772_12210, partial [Chloroflexota bacterium]
PAAWAAGRPRALAWLAADGLALMLPLTLLRALELPGRGLSVSPTLAAVMAWGGIAAGIAWLALISLLRRWRRAPAPSALAIFLAGLAWAYLLMPLAHHLLATPPGCRYITNASNFFAWDLRLQAVAVAVAGAMAWGTARFRRGGASVIPKAVCGLRNPDRSRSRPPAPKSHQPGPLAADRVGVTEDADSVNPRGARVCAPLEPFLALYGRGRSTIFCISRCTVGACLANASTPV